jgi:hypothetical protein
MIILIIQFNSILYYLCAESTAVIIIIIIIIIISTAAKNINESLDFFSKHNVFLKDMFSFA